MRILDRYIIRTYLVNFTILLVVLMTLYMLIDLLIDFDEFVKAVTRRSDERGWGYTRSLLFAIVDWYGPMLLLVYTFFSGLLVMGGMAFAFAGLSRSRELVAMLTSGMSMYRIAAPVLVAGCLLNAVALPIQEFVLPKLASKLARSKSQIELDSVKMFPVTYAPDGQGNLITASEFLTDAQLLNDVTILHRNAAGQAERRISASQARWNEDRGGWQLINGVAVNRQSENDPFGDAMLRNVEEVDFFETDLSPTLLLVRRAKNYTNLLSMADLRRLLESPAVQADDELEGNLRQIMHSRFSFFVVNILILAIAMPSFLLREPANLMLATIKGAGLSISCWNFALTVIFMGLIPVSPAVAAWLPVVVFLPLAGMMLLSIRT